MEANISAETVWATISLKDQRKLVVGSYYRPPDSRSDSIDDLESVLSFITEKFRNNPQCTIILGGDFNAGDIDWESHTVCEHSLNRQINEKILSVISSSSLAQIQKDFTRNNKILDLLCTNKPDLFSDIRSIPGISDHEIILADCDLKPVVCKKPPRTIYLWNKVDWSKIRLLASEFSKSFLPEHGTRSVEKNYTMFKEFIALTMKVHIPNKLTSTRTNLPWFNKGLKRMCKVKRRRFKRAKKSKKARDWERYVTHKKATASALKAARWDHVNGILQTNLEEKNTKPFYRYIKAQKNDNFGVSSLKFNRLMYSDSLSKSEILNKQFQSVFTKKSTTATPRLFGNKYPSIGKLSITLKGVQKLLEKINISKAAGPDLIPGRMLNMLAPELAPIVHAIFTQSLDTGELPRDWSLANVAPIFKKGNRGLAENYRPVSLTCITCKLFEHIVCRHILDHVEDHKILTNLQHGFRSGRSCETQLITTTHDLLSSFNSKSQIDVAILDFSKAFDTVPHAGLLGKLEHYGIDSKILLWITNFLNNRKQRVVVDGSFSSFADVESGVPQGTVLGPLIFLVHINDLPSCVNSKVRLFADDCLLYREIKNNQDQIDMQRDLDALMDWGSTWGMKLNAKKCNIMQVSRSRKPLQHFTV